MAKKLGFREGIRLTEFRDPVELEGTNIVAEVIEVSATYAEDGSNLRGRGRAFSRNPRNALWSFSRLLPSTRLRGSMPHAPGR